MITVNLIAVANNNNVSSAAVVKPIHTDIKGKKKKNIMTALAAAAFVVVACCCYFVAFGCPSFLENVIPSSALDAAGIKHENSAPKAGTLAAKRAAMAEARAKAARSLPVIVDEVQPAMFVDKSATRVKYSEFYPLEKMQYQKAALGQLISFLQTATPENTGFVDVVYDAPNYYFIHGTTDAPVSQRAFTERLRTVSLDFKSPKVSGDSANITEIKAFGTLRLDQFQVNESINSFVAADSVNAEIAKLRKLDGAEKINFNGLDKPVKVENFGVYKHYTYKVNCLLNFLQLNAFVSAWKTSEVRIGISHAAFARSGKDMTAAFTVDVFVKP